MKPDTTLFQYCQKLVVFSADYTNVLLAKRKGEADFDGVYSFIGGKMETTDETIVEGLRREKNEEVGSDFQIRVYPTFTKNLLYRKNDGHAMVLPHVYAVYESGDIVLNEEYSEYAWVPIAELDSFEPKIGSISEVVKDFYNMRTLLQHTTSEVI